MDSVNLMNPKNIYLLIYNKKGEFVRVRKAPVLLGQRGWSDQVLGLIWGEGLLAWFLLRSGRNLAGPPMDLKAILAKWQKLVKQKVQGSIMEWSSTCLRSEVRGPGVLP